MTTPAARPVAPSTPGSTVEDRLRAIEAGTDAALGHLDVDDLLAELLDRVAGLMGVDAVAVVLLDKASRQLAARAAWGIEEEVRQGVRLPVGTGFAGRIAATRQPVVLDRVDSTVANPLQWCAYPPGVLLERR